jgi:hypothetical protein
MQILHRFAGSIQRYSEDLSGPDRYRRDHCPQCEAHRPLTAHGFYTRTLVDSTFHGTICVRRYLCRCCKRTVSLLPEFALPYLRLGIVVIAMFLVARVLLGLTLKTAADAAKLAVMPYQRGQFWVRRFRQQAARLCGAHCPTGSAGLYLQSSSDAGVDRLDRSPSVSVCRPPCTPARLARVSRSGRAHRRAATGGTVRLSLKHTPFAWRRLTNRPYALAVEVIQMDAKAEKIALFRYGLIAPLVLEALPRTARFNPHNRRTAAYYNRPYQQCTGAARPCVTPWTSARRCTANTALFVIASNPLQRET